MSADVDFNKILAPPGSNGVVSIPDEPKRSRRLFGINTIGGRQLETPEEGHVGVVRAYMLPNMDGREDRSEPVGTISLDGRVADEPYHPGTGLHVENLGERRLF